MEYVTPVRVLKPKRRPPVSPSAACDTCRAYYRADSRLDVEYAAIIRNLPAELQRRKADMSRLRVTAAMWDQPVKDTVSPDIVRNHLLRRQRVTALLHEGFCDERRGIERCVQTYNKAVDHQRCLASQKLPYRPPRTKKARGGGDAAAAADAEAAAAAAAAAAAQPLDGDGYSDVGGSEVSGPMIDDGDDGGGFRRRWFHQEPQGAWSTEGTGPGGAADGVPRINMVDAAEVCAKRICNERLKRLQAEGNLLAAQLRDELVTSREAAAAGSGDVRPARRPVSQASRQRAAEELLSEHLPGDRPPAPFSPSAPVPPSAAAAQGSSPRRLLGDSRFWSAATRAQAMPDPAAALSASAVATSPRLRSALLSSPHAPVMSAASPRMAARRFLKEARVPGLAEEAAAASAAAEAAAKRPESIVREPPTPMPTARLGAQGAGTGTRSGTGGAGGGGGSGGGGGGSGVRTMVLPVHPLAGAAARLSAAQRQINEGMSLN